MATDINTLKSWFETGDKPTQEQFWAWMDSYWHKNEDIPLSAISGLGNLIACKADASQLQYYVKADASNIDVNAFRLKIVPLNIATVDNNDTIGNVYSKDQTDEIYYKKVKDNNRDGKIKVLGINGELVCLTDIISDQIKKHSLQMFKV